MMCIACAAQQTICSGVAYLRAHSRRDQAMLWPQAYPRGV
jgi:hypothetical protein